LKNDFGDKLSFSLLDLKTLVHCVCSWKYYLTSNVSPIICIFCFILILKGLLTSVSIFCCNDDLSRLFTNRFSATRYMKVKTMGITENLRRVWLFSANKNNQLNSLSNSTHHCGRKLTQILSEELNLWISFQNTSWKNHT